jgi:hypothetical protein
MPRTYVPAVSVMKAWINSRTDTLVGIGNPLQKGAYPIQLSGAADACYAYLSALPASQAGGAENPDMAARLSAQVYGPSGKAVEDAAVALADEIATELAGRWADVAGARIYVGDDISGPSDQPDFDLPRYVVDFSVVLTPLP